MDSASGSAVIAGLVAGGRWTDAISRAEETADDQAAAIVAAWNSGTPVEDLVLRARRLVAQRGDDVEASELVAWLECAAGNVEAATEVAGTLAERSSSLRALGLGINIAAGERVDHAQVSDSSGDLNAALEVMALLDSRAHEAAMRRARAATGGPDASWSAWLARAAAETESGDTRAALDTAFVAHRLQHSAAEPRHAIRALARRQFTLLRIVAWALFGVAFFALGAAQSKTVPASMSPLFGALAALAAPAGLMAWFVRRRRIRSLSPELRAAVEDVVRFKHNETWFVAAATLIPLASLIPSSDQPFLVLVTALLVIGAGLYVWHLYRQPIQLRPLLAFALTGLRIDVRARSQGGWKRWWTRI